MADGHSSTAGPATLAGDWTGLVVYVGNTVWDGNQFASQHIAGRLARRTPVLYVDPPLSVVSGRRDPVLAPALEGPHLRMVRPGLARLTPIAPPAFTRPLVRDVATVLLRRSIREAVRTLGVRPHAMVAGTVLPVLGATNAPLNVYYATDDFTVGAALMGLDERWVNRQVSRQIAAADKVITVSENLADKCRARGVDSTFVPNGCDVEAFSGTDSAPWPSDVDLPGPIAGFVGYLSARIDIEYLEAVADRGVSLLLVGSRQLTFDAARIEPLLARPNVAWVGPKPFAELPSYLRAIDVGLVPYTDSDFNRASFPLKTLEYLAAGRDVVSTDLPSVRWLNTDLVTIRNTSAEFATAVEKALATTRTPEAVAKRKAFCAAHSWDHRAERIATLLGLPHA